MCICVIHFVKLIWGVVSSWYHGLNQSQQMIVMHLLLTKTEAIDDGGKATNHMFCFSAPTKSTEYGAACAATSKKETKVEYKWRVLPQFPFPMPQPHTF